LLFLSIAFAVIGVVAVSSHLRVNDLYCIVYNVVSPKYVNSCPLDIVTVTVFTGVNDRVMANG
jgi:hypothetical protein